MPKRNPLDVLGVPRDASQATIKAAWRRLARENHPDLTGKDTGSYYGLDFDTEVEYGFTDKFQASLGLVGHYLEIGRAHV